MKTGLLAVGLKMQFGWLTAWRFGWLTAWRFGLLTAGRFGLLTAGRFGLLTAGRFGWLTAWRFGWLTAGRFGWLFALLFVLGGFAPASSPMATVRCTEIQDSSPAVCGFGMTPVGVGTGPELCGIALVNGDIIQECTSGGFGNCPYAMNLVVKVLKVAKDHYGLSLGRMIQEYHECRCVLTYLGANTFRVDVGGELTTVVLGSF